LSFLLPDYCPLCNNKSDPLLLICKKCIPELKPVEIKRDVLKGVIIYSFLPYSEKHRYILHQIKFEEKKFYIDDILCRIDFSFLHKYNIDLITYVPMSLSGIILRGFNQSRVIARIISKKIKKRFYPILGKSKYSKQSLKETAEERSQIVKNNPFYLKRSMYKRIREASSILIVDDLVTTGNTIKACINRIKDINPNIKFYIITLFYTEDIK